MEPSREIDELRDSLKKHVESHVEISETMKVVSEDLKEIKMAVIGSKLLGITGVIQKIKEHDEFIVLLKESNILKNVSDHTKYIESDKKQKWTIAGAWMVCTFLFFGLVEFLRIKFGK